MRNSTDPSIHRQREQQMIEHVQRLLEDDRLRIDTSRGRKPVVGFLPQVVQFDKAVDLKRLMSEAGRPDRELEATMPVGRAMQVTLSEKKWFIFKKLIGRVEVRCISPTGHLIASQSSPAVDSKQLQKLIGEIPPPTAGAPVTIVVMSTSGFTQDAHELAERRAERTVILVEPNDAGGWNVYGPVETKALTDLFDPEAEDEKRNRVREYVHANNSELSSSGLATDRIAARTQLPLQLIENELKSYAKQNPGLAAKRLDGRVVLFREGAAPAARAASAGGSNMPFLERMKQLFARKGETEKKIAFLAERRTALSQQRDRAYEEMTALETKEGELKQQFKETAAAITKRRVTSQLLQLRKDLERRQQLLAVLNQQVNVVSTHLHSLELVQQGQSAKLPTGEELAEDAEKAEEMLAQLEADNELAGSVGTIAHAGMSDEEQALYEELERESGGEGVTKVDLNHAASEEEIEQAVTQQRSQEQKSQPRRNEPEAG
jgi:hypothetical protein